MLKYNFKIAAINKDSHRHLFDLNNEDLSKIGALRTFVDSHPGYPCRVSLTDAEIGEEVILFPFEHHKTESPYQAKGPIYIKKNAVQANLQTNEIPKMLTHRLLSLRVYDKDAMMIAARTIEGKYLEKEIIGLFDNPEANYIHVHNAGPGCYNCLINRA